MEGIAIEFSPKDCTMAKMIELVDIYECLQFESNLII